MHKIFAKPLFLGKKVIFLPQCHSTNEELSNMAKKASLPEGAVVYTDHQLAGKGQRGNIWFDEPGKNILMSLLLKPIKLSASEQFLLNLITGLAVLETVQSYCEGVCQLKWPNDVYLSGAKVCGILIENNVKGNTIDYSVVGIGLNLNQKGFHIQTATSLHLETGMELDREEVMNNLLTRVEHWYLKLKGGQRGEIINVYHKHLMWRGETHEFQRGEEIFKGIIDGIDDTGRLIVDVQDGERRSFNVKEITFIA